MYFGLQQVEGVKVMLVWCRYHKSLGDFHCQPKFLQTQECFDLGAAGQSRLMLLEMCRSIDFLNDWLESMVMAVQHANLDKEFLCAGSCNLCCHTREFGRHHVKIARDHVLCALSVGQSFVGCSTYSLEFLPQEASHFFDSTQKVLGGAKGMT